MNAVSPLILILTAAAVTFATRALPFILFNGKKEMSPLILYLGNILPSAMMAILVIYAFRNISLTAYPFALPEIISAMIVVLTYLWKRNILISISTGTISYMILIQKIFITAM